MMSGLFSVDATLTNISARCNKGSIEVNTASRLFLLLNYSKFSMYCSRRVNKPFIPPGRVKSHSKCHNAEQPRGFDCWRYMNNTEFK